MEKHEKFRITEAAHPKTGEIYSVGDTVCIYQGRFGHNNIMTIKSMFAIPEHNGSEEGGNEVRVYVSDKETLPGSYLSAVKHKMSSKELRDLAKARALVSKYS